MSLQNLVVKYPRGSRLLFSFGVPFAISFLWLTVGATLAYGQEAPGSPPAGAGEWGTVPVVGTSLTAAGAFYWLIGFLKTTIERYESREKEIHLRHANEILEINKRHAEDRLQERTRYAEELKDERATSKYWSDLYHGITKEAITEARRLAHIHSPSRPAES